MKIKSFLATHQSLVRDVVVSSCLLGASAGIVFGVSAGTFHINYMNLNDADARLLASQTAGYYGENIDSAWNMNGVKDGDNVVIEATPAPDHAEIADFEDYKTTHPSLSSGDWWPGNEDSQKELELEKNEETDISDSAIKARYAYSSMVIDGATHSTMDRSFNQSLYEGLADFIKNKSLTSYDSESQTDPLEYNCAKSYKPSQDNTAAFVDTYLSVMEQHHVVGLAGFNHSTPLSNMMTHEGTNGFTTCSSESLTKMADQTAFILLDSNIANNQNIASVQFRADQPGFLTAIATCQYFFNNLDLYHDKFQDMSVGMYGGVQIPTVTIYMGGFERGIEFFNYTVLYNIIYFGSQVWFNFAPNPDDYKLWYDKFVDLVNHSKYKQQIEELPKNETGLGTFMSDIYSSFYNEFSIKSIKLGDTSTHFSGTFTAGDAIGITKQYLNRGASAIIAVAGPQSLDSAQEIQNQNSKCIVIGVDTAMENSDYQRFHKGCGEETRTKPNEADPYMDKTKAEDGTVSSQANSIIKFSAIKDIKTVTKRIVRLIAEGKRWDAERDAVDTQVGKKPDPNKAVCGPGFQTCGNILNGLISISWDGFYPLLQAFEYAYFYIRDVGTRQFIPMPLEEAWANAGADYFMGLPNPELDALQEEFPTYTGENPTLSIVEGVKDINNLLTFSHADKDDPTKDSVFYKNYNHTMGILGCLLNNLYIPFKPDMSLVREKDPETGEFTYRKMTAKDFNHEDGLMMTILDWLEVNMYLMS